MSLIKTPKELDIMRESGRILAHGVSTVLNAVAPGVSTNELDALFLETITKDSGEPSFFGYRGYPKNICTSINEEVVHAIPTNRTLKEGDIIGIDCGVRFQNFCTDMARTVPVGKISEDVKKLIEVTEESLRLAIEQLVPGNTIGDIGATVEEYAHQFGYGIVRSLVGHGVGQDVHEEPAVPNYGTRGTGMILKEGMVLAIEPMFNVGGDEVVFDEEDGWTVRTADDTLSAHFEDTIAITADGPEILTNMIT